MSAWHVVVDKNRGPKSSEVVVGVWISGSETSAELCYFDPDTREWFSANPGTRDDPLLPPDYWTEFPQ